MAAREIVERDDINTQLSESLDHMRADIARTADHQYV
jgi:hypothetical protein